VAPVSSRVKNKKTKKKKNTIKIPQKFIFIQNVEKNKTNSW
jgi:hypothetical protein